MAQKPLMLKDFLEIDANSESGDGFLCKPRRPETATVRSLLEIELGGKMIRPRSKGALSKMTALINAVNIFSSATEGRFLSRSFQKKLRRTFCKKKKTAEVGEEDRAVKVRVGDIVRLTSIEDEEVDRRSDGFPSPVVSRCSSSPESRFDTESDFGRNGGDNGVETSNGVLSRTDVGFSADYREAATGSRDQQVEEREVAMGRRECNLKEEKEQLSPVSVMEFSYQEEEEDAATEEEDTMSPSFQQTLANIERTRQQLLQKIRRFESLAELDPVDLDTRFDDPIESTDYYGEAKGEEAKAWNLLRRAKAQFPWGSQRRGFDKLLLGFFIERLETQPEDELMKAVADWIAGRGECSADDVSTHLREMDTIGRWRTVVVEVEDLAADVAVGVFGWLMEELVLDIASS